MIMDIVRASLLIFGVYSAVRAGNIKPRTARDRSRIIGASVCAFICLLASEMLR